MIASGGLGFLFKRSPTYDLRLKGLAGGDLVAGRRDWVVFDQYPVDTEGRTLGPGHARPQTYRGDDLPEGRPLYDALWSDLPTAVQAAIDADRVAR